MRYSPDNLIKELADGYMSIILLMTLLYRHNNMDIVIKCYESIIDSRPLILRFILIRLLLYALFKICFGELADGWLYY